MLFFLYFFKLANQNSFFQLLTYLKLDNECKLSFSWHGITFFLLTSNQFAHHTYWVNLLSFISVEIQLTPIKLQFNTNLDFVIYKHFGIEFSPMSSKNHLVDGKKIEKEGKTKILVKNKTWNLIQIFFILLFFLLNSLVFI